MSGDVPVIPPVARAVFGETAGKAEQYAALLADTAVTQGLLGPREVPRLWERHILNCALIAELVPAPCSIIDIGSGAGLPGIVLALLLPQCQVTLMESMLRRCVFLEETAQALGLGNIEVCRGRAEDLAGTLAADVVTARAVAPLGTLAGWAAGLLRPGGTLLAVKGARAEQEVREARRVLAQLEMRDVAVLRVGSGKVDPAVTVVRMVRSS